jgi:hypothetical protein
MSRFTVRTLCSEDFEDRSTAVREARPTYERLGLLPRTAVAA